MAFIKIKDYNGTEIIINTATICNIKKNINNQYFISFANGKDTITVTPPEVNKIFQAIGVSL